MRHENTRLTKKRILRIISTTAAVVSVIVFSAVSTFSKTKPKENPISKPQIEVPVDLEVEAREQKSVDAGHSPWRLDPIFVAQVFVSLKISPEGIEGDYPIKYEELKAVKITKKEAVVEVSGDKTPIRRVYLKRLIRQDNTGIWTVVGYDPANKK